MTVDDRSEGGGGEWGRASGGVGSVKEKEEEEEGCPLSSVFESDESRWEVKEREPRGEEEEEKDEGREVTRPFRFHKPAPTLPLPPPSVLLLDRMET